MIGPQKLTSTEDRWETHMGKMFPGETVIYRNKDLFQDLKSLSWMQLYLLGITGKIFAPKVSLLFEGIWTLCTSYPDPRIWNNRVGSLAGTARSTGTLGVSAAIAISEASIYGRRPDIRAIDFLIRAKARLARGETILNIVNGEMKSYRGIFGYGRPIVKEDERIAPLLDLAQNLALADGPHLKIAFEVEKILIKRWRLKINIAALAAALSADQGLSAREYYFFLIPSFIAGIMPCFIEANQKAEGTFLPISHKKINYTGIPPRVW